MTPPISSVMMTIQPNKPPEGYLKTTSNDGSVPYTCNSYAVCHKTIIRRKMILTIRQ
jgi:hypothetical protein